MIASHSLPARVHKSVTGAGQRTKTAAAPVAARVTRRSQAKEVYAAAPSARRALAGRRALTLLASAVSHTMNGSTSNAESEDGNTVSVPLDELESVARTAIVGLGYTEQEAQVLLDVMMYAQMRGNNQGIIKITTGGVNKDPRAGEIQVLNETALSARLDGQRVAGMLTLSKAMDMAVQKAKSQGVGIVGTSNTYTSTGALGYYVEKIANQGLIALALAQSPEFVAPFGAKQPIFGTNPIGIGIPTADGTPPVVIDMATSAYAFFGLLEAKTAGTSIPGDVAYDKHGQPTTDPNEALDGGAIRVFDRSYKGSHLALAVELLAGPLVGAAVTDKISSQNWGNLVLAIDPKLMGDVDEFKQRVVTVLNRVKNAEKLPGVKDITLPSERGNAIADKVVQSGKINLEVNLYAKLRDMASQALDASGPAASAAATPGKTGEYGIVTKLVHGGKTEDPMSASAPPLYQTATFVQPDAVSNGPYDYTRSGNPTRTALEEQMADIEGAERGLAFTSGMAALTAVTRLVKNGETILAGEDIYGGTSRLLAQCCPAAGIKVVNVDMTDLAAVEAAMTPDVKMVMLESPTNPRMQIIDIKTICSMAKRIGAISCVDNSIMAPLYQRPLEMGADICMTSATKFIAGHSDVTLGVLTCKTKEMGDRLYFYQNAEGSGASPFDCWLAIRGLKTMSLRMAKQTENAMKLAEFLNAHPLVKKVNYAGLPSHPGYDVHKQQASGPGSLLSFTTGNVEVSRCIAEETKLFKITVSFGSVSSLISLPCYMSHASIPEEVRAARGLPNDLVRISAGIEDVEDLIADLTYALDLAAQRAGIAIDTSSSKAAEKAELLAKIKELEAQIHSLD